MNDFSVRKAKQGLQAELFNREEASLYTRRNVKTFDKTLRIQLSNFGTPTRPLYSKIEIDQWLRILPGPSDESPAAQTITSAFPTTDSELTNLQVQQILRKPEESPDDSTEKS